MSRPRSAGHARCCRFEALEERQAPAILLPGFSEAAAATGLTNPTTMELSPDGKLFVAEQAGTMEVWQGGTRLEADFFAATPISTQSVGERGLLGIAFDPGYAVNRFVYVYYTTTAADNHNRVSRFTANANGDLALANSELVLLELDPHSATNHNGGAIHFGPDGRLYVATGDDANQDNPTSTPNSQRLDSRHGKILRINSDGTIPTDNPFVGTTVGANQAIWALGLRNPFTFSFSEDGTRMFIDDVGQSAWEEIDVGQAGANYGWPTTEGDFDPAAFPGFTRPFYTYSHDANVTTPSGCAITGGAFYEPALNTFGSDYSGDYFFSDLCGGWIYRIDPTTRAVTEFASEISSPVDLRVDPAGSLLYLARGTGQVMQVSAQGAAPGIDKPGLFDPVASAFYLKQLPGTGNADAVFLYGPAGNSWRPLAGDWNADHVDTVGLYDPSRSWFFLRNSNTTGNADQIVWFGPQATGWIPLVGDWNGDGQDTVGLYDPQRSWFFIKNQNTTGDADAIAAFGPAGSGWIPIVGDWNGDGKDSIGLYDPQRSWFFLKNSIAGGDADALVGFGPAATGWVPVAGDWNGDGRDGLGLLDQSRSAWFLKNTLVTGPGDAAVLYGPAGANWLPVAGDWGILSSGSPAPAAAAPPVQNAPNLGSSPAAALLSLPTPFDQRPTWLHDEAVDQLLGSDWPWADEELAGHRDGLLG